MMWTDFIDVMNFIFIANDMWMLWTAFILGELLFGRSKNKMDHRNFNWNCYRNCYRVQCLSLFFYGQI